MAVVVLQAEVGLAAALLKLEEVPEATRVLEDWEDLQ